jgi:hypothetical protein
MQKQWHAWEGESSHDPYFELAVVTPDGYRFELHHVDSETLPQVTLDALKKGGVTLPAGTVVGHVNAWAFSPEQYPHVHYNIVAPDGVRLNPEYYSVAVPDHEAPTIHGVYALMNTGNSVAVSASGSVPAGALEIIVAATDRHDGDAYVQTPPYIELALDSGAKLGWDFRRTLQGPDGHFPDIRKTFISDISLENGTTLETFGQYGEGLFLFRFPVDERMHGEFKITVGDTAGNQSLFQARLP